MAKELFKYPLLILLLVLANGIVHSIGYSDWDDGGGSSGDDNFRCLSPWEVDRPPQEPRRDFYRELRTCLNVLTRKCNRELSHYVFRKRRRMSESCCQKLVQMGRGCKDSLEWTLIHSDKYERYEGHIRERSEAAFSKCSATVRDYGWY